MSKGVETPPKKLGTPKGTPSNRVKTLFVPPPLLANSWRFQFPFPGGEPLKRGMHTTGLSLERGGGALCWPCLPKIFKNACPLYRVFSEEILVGGTALPTPPPPEWACGGVIFFAFLMGGNGVVQPIFEGFMGGWGVCCRSP